MRISKGEVPTVRRIGAILGFCGPRGAARQAREQASDL